MDPTTTSRKSRVFRVSERSAIRPQGVGEENAPLAMARPAHYAFSLANSAHLKSAPTAPSKIKSFMSQRSESASVAATQVVENSCS